MTETQKSSKILAFVGMPGSGKSEAAEYMKSKGLACIRFGDITDEKLREQNIPQTPENEQVVREQLRKKYGMAIYAQLTFPKLQQLMQSESTVVIDGLYSWEEYLFLKEKKLNIIMIQVFTQKAIRYNRLTMRSVRPLTLAEAESRDIAEIEYLNKGGPIALADYVIENNDYKEVLHTKLDEFLEKFI